MCYVIPTKMQIEYDNALDTEKNIVSLCSHYHNKIHFREGTEEIEVLCEKRIIKGHRRSC